MARITPGMPEAVIRPSHDLYVRDGDVVRGFDLHLPDPERLEEFRQGYRCVKCLGVQSVAFPVVCEQVWRGEPSLGIPETRCGYPIRDEQLRFIEQQYEGHEELWPAREVDREREDWRPGSGIWVPGRD
jgi:hypothetical protein